MLLWKTHRGCCGQSALRRDSSGRWKSALRQAFESAKENNYIEYITDRAIGHEIEQLAYEDDPLTVIKTLEKENWLKVLNPHWTTAKVDTAGLGQMAKTRQQMSELGYLTLDPAPAVLNFLTAKLADKDIADIRKLIPRKTLVEAWRDLEDNAKDLSKRLTGKEAATPSRTWKLLSEERPEMILFLAVTSKQQAVTGKIRNFFTKWRQVQTKVPLLEMTELHITPQMPEYPKIAHEVFMLLLDGKLRSHNETLKFLKPLAPPPPPPPPPPRRGRGPKAVAAAAPVAVAGKKGEVAKGKGKAAAAVPPVPAPPVAAPLASKAAASKTKEKPAKASAKPAKRPAKPVRKHPAAAAKKKSPSKTKKKKR